MGFNIDDVMEALQIVKELKDTELHIDTGDMKLSIFKGEVGDERLFDKILRGYVSHVSIQIDSDEIECSKCKKPTRKDPAKQRQKILSGRL